VVVPVHAGGAAFGRCLAHLYELRPPPLEIIVVEDGEPWPGAYPAGVRVERLAGRRGPAAARNRGAALTRGDILLFVDADVLVPPTAVAAVAETLDDERIDAVIGSYDRHPAAPGFVSQFKNLAHRFVHQQAREDGATFWGACGAIRKSRFDALGGFDESFATPSIEDIELGMRLVRGGGRVRVRKDLEVTHLKRWTLAGLIRTDVLERAVPWSALLLREGRIPDDLNVSRRARAAVALTALVALALAMAPFSPAALWAAGAAAVTLLALDWRLWRYFAVERGWAFVPGAVAMQWLYYAYSGAAFGWVWLTGDWRHRRAARVQESA
jgi:GT2 family glycosyltransferase